MKNIFGKILLVGFFIIFAFVAYITLVGQANEKLMSWIFVLMPLFLFFGFIAMIIFVIIHFIKKSKNSKKLASNNAWKYYKSLNEVNENTPFLDYLKNSLFILNNRENYILSDIINGNYKDMDFWFSFYKAFSTSGNRSTRVSSQFNIFIVPTEDIPFSNELVMFYRTKMMKLFMADKLSNLIGKPIHTIDQKGYEWMMLTDLDAFNNLKLNIADITKLKEAMQGAHSIIIEKGFFIYTIEWNTTLSEEKIMEYLIKVNEVKNILTN